MHNLQKIYDLRKDCHRVELIQKATLETKDYGLVPENGLFGSDEWWNSVETGLIKTQTVDGAISRVYMSGHNDWPGFEIDDGSEKSQWTREGDDSLYVVGKAVKLVYALQKAKRDFGTGFEHKCVVEIWIGEGDQRT